jgi:2-amino-4-hydroxy-6-hydroxymethyldihydropteridine diphosphokinase
LSSRNEKEPVSPQRRVQAFVAVGSNICPEANIPKALSALRELVEVRETSSFYRTEPKERPEQAPFYNGVWLIDTVENPVHFKYEVLRKTEARLGRRRSADKLAPREIDLDLILYGDRTISAKGLEIPDPDIYRHSFIAVPLAELAPDLRMPDTGIRIRELDSAKKGDLVPLADFSSQLKRRLANERAKSQ